MRNVFVGVAVLALGAGSTACASKGYVKTQVSQVSGKVDSLSQSLEETQERTRRAEGRITEVDGKAQAAAGAAADAQKVALTADGKAVTADGKAVAAGQAAQAANARAEAVEKASRRIVYEVVLSEDKGNFKFGATSLPDDAKASIDEMVSKLLADPKGAYFEIEGHTDNVGDGVINEKVGLQRAESVKRYLYEQHKIPLHRINVISYGEEKPAAPNTTKEGRAQNRRVVIRVLA
jgi:outer membrane protein OmpA-like peptidoglycan-associated protein